MPRQRIAAGASRRIGDGAVFLAAKAAAEEAPERLGAKRQRCFLRRLSPPSRLGDARAGIPAGSRRRLCAAAASAAKTRAENQAMTLSYPIMTFYQPTPGL